MPNYCQNHVQLSHSDAAMITRARAAFSDGRFLQEFVPSPRDPDGAIAMWGTKYICDGDGGTITDVADGAIELDFRSPWAPPYLAYEKLAALGFGINATYDDHRQMFGGTWCNGKHDSYEWGKSPRDYARFNATCLVLHGAPSYPRTGCEEGHCVCGDGECGRDEFGLIGMCRTGNCCEPPAPNPT
jgi:hypothetical protein